MRLLLHRPPRWLVAALLLGGIADTGCVPLSPAVTQFMTIVADPGAHLRDPSSPLWDATTASWHMWATRIPLSLHTKDGYLGTVHHYHAPELTGPWATSGVAVPHNATPGAFDHSGTFTPSSFHDAHDARWYLYYGGVPTGNTYYESIGLATAPSPFGPWTKSPLNPVITPARDIPWCESSSAPMLVDEAEPYVINGQKRLVVKTVCRNASLGSLCAVPMAFLPQDGSSWDPPYRLDGAPPNPLVRCNVADDHAYGFEQARIYPGPDGYLHMTGNDANGDGRQLNFISRDGSGRDWELVGRMAGFGEPTLVWPRDGGPPGDRGGVPTHMVRFDGPDPLRIDLMNLTWAAAVLPPPPPPPPAPPQTCPGGWSTHASGFWYNTDPCPRNDWANCTADTQNGTVPACERKCVRTRGCVGFDTCAEPAAGCGCYIFVGGLAEPFTPNVQSLTCLRPTPA
jgi:hypothetical protein